MTKKIIKSRNWCLTINNYTQADIDKFEEHLKNFYIKYYCYGLEKGEQGTPHIQGYVESPSPIALSGAKTLWPCAHFEIRLGTQQQAIDYCKKDGQWWVGGTQSGANGVRHDWIEINKNIKDGITIQDQIKYGFGSLQHIQHMEKISKYLEPKRKWVPEVYWIYGPPGTGKSKLAYEMDEDLFTVPSFKWWDGYDGHKTILIDDYRADWCKFNDLLKILDRYPYQVEIKGGYRQLLCKKIIITTPLSPEETWECRNAEDMKQLTRRITKVIHVTG